MNQSGITTLRTPGTNQY